MEDGLNQLGFRHILCVRAPESFAKAREARLIISGNPSQYDDLEPFVREQSHFQQLAKESILPIIEIDISDDNVAGAADQIADWLEETGGLYAT